MPIRQKFEHQQKPVFTQSLQQSIKILELPLMELKNIVEAELVENPVMEEVQKEPSSETEITPQPQAEAPPEEDNTSLFEKGIVSKEFADYEKPIFGKKESLEETLLRQLRINAEDEGQIKIGAYIIDHIDENGYLREAIPALCAKAQASEEEVMKALKLIQTFEPAGIGARDLKECLLIQLKKRNENDSLTLKLVEDHIEDLAGQDLDKLLKKLKCTREELAHCIKKIRGLEPKPGRSYSTDEIAYIIPDVIIEEKDEQLNIIAKDDTIPTVRINPVYKNMLKSKKINEETKDFIRQRLTNANNLIRAIASRKQTLTRVVSIIAETQKEALLEGMEKLKPLSLKEVAEKLGLHESTISRVVMNKYVETPIGIFALKDFFSTSLKREDGEDVSSQSIKLKIQELIETEDKTHPLKDHEIALLLKGSQKIHIARRTVAKYREMFKIPPAPQRRRSI